MEELYYFDLLTKMQIIIWGGIGLLDWMQSIRVFIVLMHTWPRQIEYWVYSG